jgi:hypothetical protein
MDENVNGAPDVEPAVGPVPAEEPSTPVADDGPTVTAEEQRQRMSRLAVVKERLQAMPKVVVRVREDTPVIYNGYPFYLKGGERVKVPEVIAEILEQSGLI